MLITLERATRTNLSPIGLISPKADKVFIEVLRKWKKQLLRQ